MKQREHEKNILFPLPIQFIAGVLLVITNWKQEGKGTQVMQSTCKESSYKSREQGTDVLDLSGNWGLTALSIIVDSRLPVLVVQMYC